MGLLAAVVNVSLISFDLKALVVAKTLPLRLLILISIRVFMIFVFLLISAGIFISKVLFCLELVKWCWNYHLTAQSIFKIIGPLVSDDTI